LVVGAAIAVVAVVASGVGNVEQQQIEELNDIQAALADKSVMVYARAFAQDIQSL